MRLVSALIATAIAGIASAAGAHAQQTDSQAFPPDTAAGEIVGLTPCAYEADKVEYQADCGTLAVAENRADPGTRLIGLPVIRVRATGAEALAPIFWLNGGPGNSNLKFTHLQGLVDRHDIVMVGYRGMDGAQALDCPEMVAATSGVGGDLLSPASIAAFGDAIRRCAGRLQAEGYDLAGYSPLDVVRDLEAARQSLGYDKINLLSVSYGTRPAMMYAWMFPASIERSAMISVNPPGHFVWEPDVVDGLIRRDAELCAADPACSARTADLAEAMRRVLDDPPARWLVFPIDAGKVRFLSNFMLFHRGTAAAIFDAYLAADAGDASGLAMLSLMHDLIIPSSVAWGDWISKGASDYAAPRDWAAEMIPPGAILGSPISLYVGGAVMANGGWEATGWPVAPVPPDLGRVQPSDVRTLLVSGDLDYSTPVQFARDELLPALGNGEQVILANFGHSDDVWGLQPEATRHLFTTFFASGAVDASRFSEQPMNFEVGLGLPLMAKFGVTVVLLLALALVFAVWWLVRILSRRRARA